MITGDSHAEETIMCREASQKIKHRSAGATGYDRQSWGTLLSGKKQKDQAKVAELHSCHHNWIFEEWGKSAAWSKYWVLL